jgi:hypothetical protein
MADAAASVCAVGTLAQPAIAIAVPSASTHQRDPLIALSSSDTTTRIPGASRQTFRRALLPAGFALEKEIARTSRAMPLFDETSRIVGRHDQAKATEFNGL